MLLRIIHNINGFFFYNGSHWTYIMVVRITYYYFGSLVKKKNNSSKMNTSVTTRLKIIFKKKT